ncbi:acyl-CoA dehydrogenase family protein [Streptomyces sp. NPDC001595]|uniref:acyl-CoA dehydrogenase family protein n=1 Tax=Streptomyces sp. NPDC001532 TaxID=3154520 RepID=UPI00331FC676
MFQQVEAPFRGTEESDRADGSIPLLRTASAGATTAVATSAAVASAPARTRTTVAPVEGSALDELTHLLFEGDERDRVHGPWRALVGGEEFAYRPGLPPQERAELSYQRLRLVNSAVPSAEALTYDARRLAALHEWTGFVDGGLCTLASIHYNLFLGSLLDHDGYRRDLTPYAAMRRTGVFLCTELEHGNDVANLQTVARFDRETGGFILHTPTVGAQKFMPNTSLTGGPKSAVVAARLLVDDEDQGIFLFLTPLSDDNGHLPGVRVRRLPERTGTPVDHCLTAFEHVRLPREAMLEAAHGRLDEDGKLTSSLGNRRKRFLRSVGRVTVGKLCMSAGTLGMARAALTIAVRYAHHRQIGGTKAGQRVPLTAHRSHHARLLRSLSTAYAMTFLQRSMVDRWMTHDETDREQREEIERLIAVAKGWITWQARDITIESRERCGAQGLFPHNNLADLQLNVEGGITAEGDNLVIWVKAASEMVFGHESGPEQPMAPGGRDLTDLGFLRDLLASAERIWQTRAREALRGGPAGDPIGRWNATSGAALEMVSAHARLQAADALLAAADTARNARARFLLENMSRLFLLEQLRQHTGDLLAAGLMTPEQMVSLHNTADRVIADLAPHMMTLVDAFDLPEEFLSRVPIAGPDYMDHYHQHPTPDPQPEPTRATATRTTTPIATEGIATRTTTPIATEGIATRTTTPIATEGIATGTTTQSLPEPALTSALESAVESVLESASEPEPLPEPTPA